MMIHTGCSNPTTRVRRCDRQLRLMPPKLGRRGMEVTHGDEAEAARERTSRDIPHNDDVIIDGNLCVGDDYVVGEAFGYDTIR